MWQSNFEAIRTFEPRILRLRDFEISRYYVLTDIETGPYRLFYDMVVEIDDSEITLLGDDMLTKGLKGLTTGNSISYEVNEQAD